MTGLAGLVAYQVALEFAQKVYELEVKGSLRDQITRAAESVVLNIAEAHPAKGADRARRFRIAASEASECRGCTGIAQDPQAHQRGEIRRDVESRRSDRRDALPAGSAGLSPEPVCSRQIPRTRRARQKAACVVGRDAVFRLRFRFRRSGSRRPVPEVRRPTAGCRRPRPET